MDHEISEQLYEWAHRLAAIETLARYAQPLPDGYFCRSVILRAVGCLTADMPLEVQGELRTVVSEFLPACWPPDLCG